MQGLVLKNLGSNLKKQDQSWSTKWLKLSSKLVLDFNKWQKIDGHNSLLKKILAGGRSWGKMRGWEWD